MTSNIDTAVTSVGDDPRRYGFTVWNYRQGEIVAAMIYLGNELGFYKAMAGAGPVTAGELAQRTVGVATPAGRGKITRLLRR